MTSDSGTLPPEVPRVRFPQPVRLLAPHPWDPRRSTMAQSHTLLSGREVHPASLAGAPYAPDHGAEGPARGALGTRQCAMAQLRRTLPSQAPPLGGGSDAGPGGSWLARSRTKKNDAGWGGAPALMPQQAGHRIKTARRAAAPWARRARAGALPRVSVPTGDAAARRALTPAREHTLRARPDAPRRLQACVRRPEMRSSGPAPWHPAPLR
jgi:hypothetical protein